MQLFTTKHTIFQRLAAEQNTYQLQSNSKQKKKCLLHLYIIYICLACESQNECIRAWLSLQIVTHVFSIQVNSDV
jgi:hypothetical protein